MARRQLLGCLPVVLALFAWTACDDKGAAPGTKTTTVDLDKRCIQLAKICGDKGKHVEKITEECKLAATTQLAKGCTDKVTAVYDCYERELCGSGDKVWTIEDLRRLATRHNKCVVEQEAIRTCEK